MKKLLAFGASLALATTAFSADFQFYGNAFYEYFGTVTTVNGGKTDSAQGSTMSCMESGAFFGSKIKGSGYEALVELGTQDPFFGNNVVRVRKLYGVWNIDKDMSLLFGQATSLLAFIPSNQAFGDNASLIGYGAIFNGRKPQFQFRYNTLKVALYEGNKENVRLGDFTAKSAQIPTVEASYSYAVNKEMTLDAGVGYSGIMYKGSKAKPYKENYYVPSFVGALNFWYATDAFYAGLDAGYSMNINTYGLISYVYPPKVSMFVPELDIDGNVVNTNSILASAAFGYKPSATLGVEAGVGYETHMITKAYGKKNETDVFPVLAYYVNCSYYPVPAISFTPEVGSVMNMTRTIGGKDVKDETTYYGGIRAGVAF